ncbi:hypothetical protein T439DRAFT_328253 [Meredithblackwellia eburnea MCA 4105]
MATTASGTPIPGADNLTTKQSNSLKRVTDYPLVKSTLTTAYSYISSNNLSLRLYTTLESYSHKALEIAIPHLPVSTVDSYASAGLDYVEKKFPQVKTETGEDLVKRVRKPADDAVGLAKTYADGIQSRLSPVTELVNARITQSQETLHALQERLSSTVASLPRDKASAQEALNSIKGEIESVSTYLSTHAKELPAQAQAAAKPYLDALAKGASHIKDELAKPDTTLTTKASNILNYTTEQVGPILQSVRELLVKKKVEVVETVESVAPKVNGSA